jgi:integrase/recombinase XerD
MLEQSEHEDASHRVDSFANYLAGQGYAEGTIDHYRQCCRHFVVWLQQHRIALAAVDEVIVEQFADHDCDCPKVVTSRAKRSRSYLLKIQRFVRYLVMIGVIPDSRPAGCPETDHFRAFRDWMRRHRGTGERTILAHTQTITGLLPQLGDDPGRYDAALINRVMLENLESISRFSAQRLCGSLRMYLRFLAATGACPPALIGAIPRIPQWRLSALPRYILNDDVERVIASCDTTTARGLRDRAILLLLARLALRAGDVANLHLHDIDWENALIQVAGKTRRTVALPLPQDAGDALLAYIEHARPAIGSSKIFIRVIAPFKPFASSSPIAIIVRDALKRAEVENTNLRGAYLLRHSAATNMLRSGATLDAVGALLRHRSPETTAIYAKVDTCMLSQVAQPWIGSVTCR